MSLASFSDVSLFQTGTIEFLYYTSIWYPCFLLIVFQESFSICERDS